jgi:hypothetical protein
LNDAAAEDVELTSVISIGSIGPKLDDWTKTVPGLAHSHVTIVMFSFGQRKPALRKKLRLLAHRCAI